MSDAMITRRGGGGGKEIKLQTKFATPSISSQDVLPGNGFDALSKVTVNPIPNMIPAATITPGTEDQTINAGQWLFGAQTIKGDKNLVAANIKKGVSIFGVSGNLETDIAVSDYALICAKIPSGANCVCAISSDIKMRENVPGIAAFAIPTYGNWCTTIYDSVKSRTVLVKISGRGEIRAVQVNYPSSDPTETDAGLILSPARGLRSNYSLVGAASMSGNAIIGNAGESDDKFTVYTVNGLPYKNYKRLTITGYLREKRENVSIIDLTHLSTSRMTVPWMGEQNQLYTLSLDLTVFNDEYGEDLPYIDFIQNGNCLEITKILLSAD